MSLIVQATRKAAEYGFTHKENKLFNRSIEALKYDVANKFNAESLDTFIQQQQSDGRRTATDSNTLSSGTNLNAMLNNVSNSPGGRGGGSGGGTPSIGSSFRKKKPDTVDVRPYSIRILTALIKMTFSNVGLIAVVFLYSTLGALMFQLLEQHEELRLCEEGKGKFLKELKQCRENILLYVTYNTTNMAHFGATSFAQQHNEKNRTLRIRRSDSSSSSNNTKNASSYFISQLDPSANYSLESYLATTSTTSTSTQPPHSSLFNDDQYTYINLLLREFRRQIIEIQENTTYYGQDCELDSKWNLFSSILFTITTISTIGYGFTAPITWEGRVVCVCYASMGIPIFLMCLANLSSSFAKMFRFIYAKVDAVNPVAKFLERRRKENKAKRKAKKKNALLTGKKDFRNVIVVQDGQSIVTKSDLSSNVAVVLGNPKELEEFNVAYEFNLIEEDDNSSDDDEDDEDDDGDGYYYENVEGEVPISLAVLVIVLYMTGGAWLFQKFEGWSFSKSFYFVFVTLTTMGFGDLVPGQSRNDKYAGLKQLTVCFYSLFGMSIFGMCMSVTHYVARRKLMWLFAKIRLWFSCFDRRKPEKPTIKSPQDLNETLMEKEREKETILNRLKLLQHYEKAISAKRRKRHVLS